MENDLILMYKIIFCMFGVFFLIRIYAWYIEYKQYKDFVPRKIWNQWEHNEWGDYIGYHTTDDWRCGKIYGFLFDLQIGDEIRWKVKKQSDGTEAIGRFRVVSVKFYFDPPDMFNATITQIGYLEG